MNEKVNVKRLVYTVYVGGFIMNKSAIRSIDDVINNLGNALCTTLSGGKARGLPNLEAVIDACTEYEDELVLLLYKLIDIKAKAKANMPINKD